MFVTQHNTLYATIVPASYIAKTRYWQYREFIATTDMAHQEAIVSTNAGGEPEIGPEITTVLKKVPTPKRRALIGWNHQNDTPDGLRSGKVWCWVSEDDRLQVYDENFNRSEKAGDIRFCGVANFTMVRMFHPYWSLHGRAPRDMQSTDKRRCRAKYGQLIRRWRIKNGLPVDDEPDNDIQPDQPEGPTRKKRGRPAKRSTGGPPPKRLRQRQAQRERQRRTSPIVTGREEEIAGFAANNPRAISDDEDSDWNDNIPLVQRSRPDTGRPRLSDMANVIESIFGKRRSNGGLEEGAEDNIKEEDVAQDTTQVTGATNDLGNGTMSDFRGRSVHTPVLNPTSEQTTQAEQHSQLSTETAPGLSQIGEDNSQFDDLRNAIAESLNQSTQDTTQDTTQEIVEEDSFMSELVAAAAATGAGREAGLKQDEEEVRECVPFPITPISEVIVIDD